jgi:acetoacetate decarboxylase
MRSIMNFNDILAKASIPLASPSYPHGPFRFVNREYLIIAYESDPAAIREAVPEPLQPDGSNVVLYEFINMPDSSGLGSYAESGVVIPAQHKGVGINFVAQMYLDNEPAIYAGREIWGFPKKGGKPKLTTKGDTLTGILEYAGVQVALGTMPYKHSKLTDADEVISRLGKEQANFKLVPDFDGKPLVAQLVSYNLCDIVLKGSWSGPARLHLVPHVNAPVADLPVKRVFGATHIIADLTLPYGRVLHDYLG